MATAHTVYRFPTHPRMPGVVKTEVPVKRILIVDDSLPMRMILRTMLLTDNTAEWQIVEARGGQEFLDAVSSQPPFDIVMLDVQMPDIDGFTACRILRQRDQRVPVVFVTSESDLASFSRGRTAGGDSYLVKPFSPAALKATLHVLTSMTRREPTATVPPPEAA